LNGVGDVLAVMADDERAERPIYYCSPLIGGVEKSDV
jgi:hypothetical protein